MPIFASVRLKASLWEALPNFRKRARWFMDNAPRASAFTTFFAQGKLSELICLVDKPRFQRLFARMLKNEQEFLFRSGCVRFRASILNVRSF